jgi:hypothetical protein
MDQDNIVYTAECMVVQFGHLRGFCNGCDYLVSAFGKIKAGPGCISVEAKRAQSGPRHFCWSVDPLNRWREVL